MAAENKMVTNCQAGNFLHLYGSSYWRFANYIFWKIKWPPNHKSDHNSPNFETRSSRCCMVVHSDPSYITHFEKLKGDQKWSPLGANQKYKNPKRNLENIYVFVFELVRICTKRQKVPGISTKTKKCKKS